MKKIIAIGLIFMAALLSAQTSITELEKEIISTGMATFEQGIAFAGSQSTNEQVAAIVGQKLLDSIPEVQISSHLSLINGFGYRFTNIVSQYSNWGALMNERRDAIRDSDYIAAKQKALSGDVSTRNLDIISQYKAWSHKDSNRKQSLQTIYSVAVSNKVECYGMCAIMYELSLNEVDIANMAIRVLFNNASKSEVNHLRLLLNQIAFKQAVKVARQSNRPTVNIVIPEYQAFIDAQRTGAGFIDAAKALGMMVPEGWSSKVQEAQKIINDVFDGTIIVPTASQLLLIEVFLGTDTVKNFVNDYNKM